MPFKSDLDCGWIKGKNKIYLEKTLEYWDNRSKQLFVIPIGFESDCASIPKILWTIVGHPFQAKSRRPSVLHDFLYTNRVVKRKVADQMFYDALIEEGMEEIKAQAFYLCVRLYGKKIYDNNI